MSRAKKKGFHCALTDIEGAQQIAGAVLRYGHSVASVARQLGIDATTARHKLHLWCRNTQPALYARLLRKSENPEECAGPLLPLLWQLRAHADEFLDPYDPMA